MTPLADFESHHIEGYAQAALEAGTDGAFRVPLVSQIDGNLWMGGCKDGVHLAGFDFVVSLYPWEKYRLDDGCHRDEAALYDAARMPETAALLDLAERVNRYRKLGRTLVHCQAGLNRSGLVTALALVLDGSTPADAIALLREKRHAVVLCNQTFAAWLMALDGAGPLQRGHCSAHGEDFPCDGCEAS